LQSWIFLGQKGEEFLKALSFAHGTFSVLMARWRLGWSLNICQISAGQEYDTKN
jgi:hypothetical protein